MDTLIQETLAANVDLPRHQLVVFTWGNVSAIDRETGLVVIKPSGVPFDQLESRHMVIVDLNGKVVSGTYRPSTETATHLEIYRQFPTVQSVAHTHSRWATIWAQACLDIPAFGTTHADYFYGNIPCTRLLTDAEIEGEYERNTGRLIASTFADRNLDPVAIPGILVAGHGPFTWGDCPADAIQNAVALEECAMMACQARILNPNLTAVSQAMLDRHHQRRLSKSAHYNQP